MKWKIIAVEDSSFIGDDGKEVTGIHVFLVPVIERDSDTRKPRRIFLSDAKLGYMSYKPATGDEVYLFEGDGDKIVSIRKA